LEQEIRTGKTEYRWVAKYLKSNARIFEAACDYAISKIENDPSSWQSETDDVKYAEKVQKALIEKMKARLLREKSGLEKFEESFYSEPDAVNFRYYQSDIYFRENKVTESLRWLPDFVINDPEIQPILDFLIIFDLKRHPTLLRKIPQRIQNKKDLIALLPSWIAGINKDVYFYRQLEPEIQNLPEIQAAVFGANVKKFMNILCFIIV
jgi:hypothetical protein